MHLQCPVAIVQSQLLRGRLLLLLLLPLLLLLLSSVLPAAAHATVHAAACSGAPIGMHGTQRLLQGTRDAQQQFPYKQPSGNGSSGGAAAGATPTSCSVMLTAAAARVTCNGPPGVVSLARAQHGMKVSASSNVKLADPSCTASIPPAALSLEPWMTAGLPRAAAAVAVLRLCSSAPHLVLADTFVAGVTVGAPRPSASLSATAAALSVVSLTGSVTLQNCSASGVRGGAAVHLAVGGSSVVVQASSFTGNSAGAAALGGGLVLVPGAATRLATISDCTFSGNTAQGGAGAWVDLRGVQPGAQLALTGSNHFVSGTSEPSGFGSGLTVNMTGTVAAAVDVGDAALFAGNKGSASLIVSSRHSRAAKITVAGQATFANNSAAGDSGAGLLVSAFNSTAPAVRISGNVSFLGCTSYLGGGAYIRLVNTTSAVAVISGNSVFKSNTAAVGGGVLIMASPSVSTTVSITGSVRFQSNIAAEDGGGVALDLGSSGGGTVRIGGSAVFQSNGCGWRGGGAYISFNESTWGKVLVNGDSLFEDNHAVNMSGGGMFVLLGDATRGSFSLAGRAVFRANTASSGGGASAFLGRAAFSNATMQGNVTFQGNTARDGAGTVVFMDFSQACTAIVTGGVFFQSNNASGLAGGAWLSAMSSQSTSLAIDGSTHFEGNIAGSDGGGAYLDLSSSELGTGRIGGRAVFQGNTCGWRGGGAFVDFNKSSRGKVFVEGAPVFEKNRAKEMGGGGLFTLLGRSNHSSVSISGSATFHANTAEAGAGVSVLMGGAAFTDVSVNGSVSFRGNRATDYAGALWVSGPKARNCTVGISGSCRFVRNSAASMAGAVSLFFPNCQGCGISIGGQVVLQANNATLGFGGAASIVLENSTHSSATVDQGAVFDSNTAALQGGGVWISLLNTLRCQASIIGQARFTHNVAAVGGGSWLGFNNASSSRLHVGGVASFEGNFASQFGGATYIAAVQSINSHASIGGSTLFVSNVASQIAGGVAVVAVNATNFRCVVGSATARSACSQPQFVSNSAANTGGLAVVISSSDGTRLHIRSAGFVGNSALQQSGGLSVHANTSTNCGVRVSDSCFQSNRVVQGSGGGMYAVAGPPTGNFTNLVQFSITNSRFASNVVSSGNGGGLVLDGSSWWLLPENCNASDWEQCDPTLSLKNCSFVGNAATLGGGFWAINTQCRIASTTFTRNHAEHSGGGMMAKGVAVLVLQDVLFDGNGARDQGGGLATVVGDDFSANRMMCRNCTIRNNRAQVGGGVYHMGGNNTYLASTITANSARRRGGGCAYFDICPWPQDPSPPAAAPATSGWHTGAALDTSLNDTCRLRLVNTSISGNEASVGGGVFLGTPGTLAYSPQQLQEATAGRGGNSATFSNEVAVAPGRDSVTVASITRVPVPSSTGAVGATGLVVLTDQNDTRLQVEFCNIKQRGGAYLTGIEASSSEPVLGNSTILRQFAARFEDLRLMRGVGGQTYCLRVLAPDFPLVTPPEVNLTIRGCIAGEQNDPVAGCTPCPANQYAFMADVTCANCNPNAQCKGGARFVPRPGFWHSAWNSSALYHCPNKAACRGSASEAASACQEQGMACSYVRDADTCNQTAGAVCYQYSDLLCATEYTSKLCSRCAQGYGSAAAFRCKRCRSQGVTAVYLLLACIVAGLVIAGIGIRAVVRQQLQRQTDLPAPAATDDNVVQLNDATANSSSQPMEDVVPTTSGTIGHAQPKEVAQDDDPVLTGSGRRKWQWLRWSTSDANSTQETPASARLHARLQQLLRDVEVADVFKVLVVYAQYIAILRNLVIDWPRGMLALMAAARVVVAPGSSDWVSLDCLGNVSSGALLWLRVFVALLVVGLASGLACALVAWGPGLWSWMRSSVLPKLCLAKRRGVHYSSPESPLALSDVAVAAAIAGLFSVYASLVTTSMSAFACLAVDGQRYWVRDPDVRCWSRQHAAKGLVPGLLGLLVLCVGVPAAVLAVSRHRAALPAEKVPRFDRRYGFLYRLYRDGCHHWEALLCLQTVALVAVDQLARQVGALYQLVAVTLVLFVSTALWVIWQPFSSPVLVVLYLAGLGCLQMTCLLMMALLRGYKLGSVDLEGGVVSEGVRLLAGAALVLMNAAFVLTCLGALGHTLLARVLAYDSWLRRSMRWAWLESQEWLDSQRQGRRLQPLSSQGG